MVHNPKLTGERMNKVNEASPASETSDVERIVMFPMTREGFESAKDYLIVIGKYDAFMNNKTSLDGFSLVAFANSILTGT